VVIDPLSTELLQLCERAFISEAQLVLLVPVVVGAHPIEALVVLLGEPALEGVLSCIGVGGVVGAAAGALALASRAASVSGTSSATPPAGLRPIFFGDFLGEERRCWCRRQNVPSADAHCKQRDQRDQRPPTQEPNGGFVPDAQMIPFPAADVAGTAIF